MDRSLPIFNLFKLLSCKEIQKARQARWISPSALRLSVCVPHVIGKDFPETPEHLGMEVAGDPNFPREISCVQVLNERKLPFEGLERVIVADFLESL
jgi:hypothetical protein